MAKPQTEEDPVVGPEDEPHLKDQEAAEPPAATHGAEDEAWETDGHDARHLEEEVATLQARVAELEAEARTLNDKWLRARADYDNLQRRTEAERERYSLEAAGRLIERLLDPLDVLSRAAADAEGSKDPHAQGIRLTHRSLWTALEREGLEEVPGVGAPFDVALHEAVAREPSDQPDGTVCEVVRPGYRLRGRLLRAALVKVSEGPPQE